MRRANFEICVASYGQTDRDGTFLKNRFERSIYNLAIALSGRNSKNNFPNHILDPVSFSYAKSDI